MISNETALFLAMTACGAAVSVLYDFMRAVRGAVKTGAVLTAVTDIIFAFVSFAAAAWCVLAFGDGRLRIFEAIGMLIGAALYFAVLSGAVYRFFLYCIKKFLKITAFIFKILLTPLLFLYKILRVPIKKCAESIKQRSRNSNAEQTEKSSGKLHKRSQKGTYNRRRRGIGRLDAIKRRHAVSEARRTEKGNSGIKQQN